MDSGDGYTTRNMLKNNELHTLIVWYVNYMAIKRIQKEVNMKKENNNQQGKF